MSRIFHGYAPWKGPIEGRRNGVLISNGDGRGDGHLRALVSRRARRDLMIEAQHSRLCRHDHRRAQPRQRSRGQSVMKSKQLTNFRASGKDDAVKLTPPRLHHPRAGDRAISATTSSWK
jgi:GTP-binding protein